MVYVEVVGLDGAGKSRLAVSLVHALGDCARLMQICQAEVSRDVARQVSISASVSPITRAFGYMAAHSEVYDRIAPDLNSLDYLIGDRGYACFYAYQHECPSEVIYDLWTIAMRGLFPDLLVFLDTPVWLCQERIVRRRVRSVIDKKPASFHRAVRERYLAFCDSYSKGQVLTLDGSRHPNILRKQVLRALEKLSYLR